MITNSDKLASMIQAMKAEERQAVASAAAFCLSKDNIAKIGTSWSPKIQGMSGPIAQMLRALHEAGGVSGDWTLCEAPISKNGKLAVLLFEGDEADVCAEIEVAKVQTA